MSGNAFKDYDVQLASRKEYTSIFNYLKSYFPAVKAAGSTQFFEKRSYSSRKNDLDFVVEVNKKTILDFLNENDHFESYRVFGNTVSTLFKSDSGYIHVDLMPSKNVKDEAWVMTGGSKKFKGVVRNVLLCFLARQKSDTETQLSGETVKWTIAFPGGIGLREQGKSPKQRFTDPRFILETLGLPNCAYAVDDAKTFEGLCYLFTWTPELLSGFEAYAKSQWLYKKSPEVFDNAFQYIKNNRLSCWVTPSF